MQRLLSQMIGRHVTIEQADSEQLSGRLIDVKSDYLAVHEQNVQVDRQYVYIHLGHIVSVVVNHAELVLPFDEGEAELLPSFAELLRSLTGQIIHIGAGNHANDGVVYQVNDEEISLILDMRHTIYYPLRQIQRFSLVLNSNKQSKVNEKSEGNIVDVLPEQNISEVKSQEKQEKDTAAPSNPTVFHVEHFDLDEEVMDYNTRQDEPMLVACMQREVTQKRKMHNRKPEHTNMSNLTLFCSMNKHLGDGANSFRRKLS